MWFSLFFFFFPFSRETKMQEWAIGKYLQKAGEKSPYRLGVRNHKFTNTYSKSFLVNFSTFSDATFLWKRNLLFIALCACKIILLYRWLEDSIWSRNRFRWKIVLNKLEQCRIFTQTLNLCCWWSYIFDEISSKFCFVCSW